MIDNRNFQNVFQQSAALSHHREEPLFYLQLTSIHSCKKMTFPRSYETVCLLASLTTLGKVISKLFYNKFLILKRDNEFLHNIPTIGHEINDYY